MRASRARPLVVRLGDSRIRQGDFKILPPKSKIATVALKIGISKKEKHSIITKLRKESIFEKIRKNIESGFSPESGFFRNFLHHVIWGDLRTLENQNL